MIFYIECSEALMHNKEFINDDKKLIDMLDSTVASNDVKSTNVAIEDNNKSIYFDCLSSIRDSNNNSFVEKDSFIIEELLNQESLTNVMDEAYLKKNEFIPVYDAISLDDLVLRTPDKEDNVLKKEEDNGLKKEEDIELFKKLSHIVSIHVDKKSETSVNVSDLKADKFIVRHKSTGNLCSKPKDICVDIVDNKNVVVQGDKISLNSNMTFGIKSNKDLFIFISLFVVVCVIVVVCCYYFSSDD